MALINENPALLTVRFVDNNLKPSTVQFNLVAGIDTLAEALTAANAIRDALAGVSNARIDGASVSFILTENDLLDPIPAESEVERKLCINVRGTNRRDQASFEVPSPIFTMEQAGTDTVVGTAEVAALLAAIYANATTTHGAALSTLNGPVYIDHRNRRRA